MEIKKCLQQIFDIFNDFSEFFSSFPLRKSLNNSEGENPKNKKEQNFEMIKKENIKKNMLKFLQNLKEMDQNLPEISNENILITNFLDIMFDEVKNKIIYYKIRQKKIWKKFPPHIFSRNTINY